MLKENSNLRAALKTVEQMKMEVENEKVAIQDQVRGGLMERRTDFGIHPSIMHACMQLQDLNA